MWFGPRPALVITEPEVVRELLLKNYILQKIPGSPLTSFLGKGLVMLETELWAKHRKLINPAFQVQKLKVCPTYGGSGFGSEDNGTVTGPTSFSR